MKIPNGCQILKYHNLKTNLPTADEVPTLSKIENLPVFKDDAEPYYKIEAIDFPANGTGGIYTKQFFKSFINKLKERPFPGSKRGHEFLSRPNTDFYTIGGMIQENADGESGTAFLKIYIPNKLDSDNYGFINDAKANIVNFSLVTVPRSVMKKDRDGNEITHFTASEGYERNDAVEYGAGAMAQIVNSCTVEDFNEMKELIAAGKYDAKNKLDGELIQNGLVIRSALRSKVSRANEENKSDYAELISLIDKKENSRRKTLNKEELFEILSNLYKNGQTNASEILASVGITDKVRNEKDEKNAEAVKGLIDTFGADYLETIQKIKAENESNVDYAVRAAISAVVGTEKTKDAKGEEVENLEFARAYELCKNLKGDELKAAVEKLPEDKFIKVIRQNKADLNSSVNVIKTGVDEAKKETKKY
jgi:hypothetical protein